MFWSSLQKNKWESVSTNIKIQIKNEVLEVVGETRDLGVRIDTNT